MANPEASYQQQQQLLDEFGRLDLNKVDVNEVTQYSLMKKVLEGKGKDFNSLLPPIVIQTLEGEDYEFVPPIFVTDSSKETNLESSNELMNYFVSKKYSEGLLKINNKDIASLVSHVKFLRVPKENNKPVFNKATEINFSTHYSKKSLDTILQDTTSCGLVSLKVDVISNTGAYYAYKGVMSLFFANARVLVENPKYNLLLTTPTKDEDKKPVVYSLIFGWANTTINPSEEEKVRTLYEENVCLLLSITNYELQFQPDGSITLTLNFIGGVEAETDGVKADILADKYFIEQKTKQQSEEIQTRRDILKEQEEEYKKVIQDYELQIAEKEEALKKDAYSNANDKDKDLKYIEYVKNEIAGGAKTKQIQELREQAKKTEDRITSEIANLKYTSFMTQMYEKNSVYQGKTQFAANASGSTIQFIPVDVVTYKLIDEQAYFGSIASRADLEKTFSRAQKINEAKSSSTELSLAEQELIAAFTNQEQTQFSTAKALFEQTAGKGENGPPVPYGNIYFNYMLVGDIISIAASNAYVNLTEKKGDNAPYENMRFVLGTLDLEQTKDLPDSFESIKEQITLDIASIPIAYNVFASWFIKNVVSKKRQEYPFNQFLKDFLNDCVLTTIHNYSKFEDKFAKSKLEKVLVSTYALKTFNDEAIEVYYTDMPYKLEDIFETRKINPSTVRNLFQNEKTRKKISPFVEKDNFKKNVYKYGFVYGKFGSLNRSGDFRDNLANGIFHFYVGSTTGILKDIKFVPMNNPDRYNAQLVNNLGGANGKPVDERFNVIQRYDVNISCFGFQYFKPGQIIFVDTSLLGFGKPLDLNSISSKFTLGGYYLITNVSHDIEGNDFSTSIVAKFLDRGKAKN